MQYDVSTPEEYFEALEDDWRKEKLLQIRRLILDSADDLSEGIQYKMLSYSDTKGVFCNLNAQKNYVAFYVGNASKVDPDGSLLSGIDCGKGCVRFKRSDDVMSKNIKSFISKTVQMWKDGKDIAC